jgi:hypothetical protein
MTCDPKPYLAFRGLEPKSVIECAVCPTKFVAEEGVAFPAKCHDEPIVAYFCSAICFLTALPIQSSGRA